jgi:GNAT superfamily N-acetyltransferase
MESVEFRLATAGDLESLVALRAEFLAELTGCDPDDPTLLTAMSRYFSATIPTGDFIAYLAVADGRVVATSGLIIHQHPPSARNQEGREAYVMNMYTVPAWRGRGLASSLLQRVLSAARQANCGRVILHATKRAAPIYLNAGFEAVESEMRHDLC